MARRHLSETARKFLREVGSIVLGVLVALGIGEVADDVRWRFRAADSISAMNVELAQAAGVLDERLSVQPCLTRRLDELDQLVRTARRTGSLPDIRKIGGPPMRPLATAAWDDAVASGTLPHLDSDLRSGLSLNYPLLKAYPANTAEEGASWANLHIIEGVPGPASDTVLTEAAGIIARLRWGTRMNSVNAGQIREGLAARRIKPSYFFVFDREGTRAEIEELLRDRPVCRPLRMSTTGGNRVSRSTSHTAAPAAHPLAQAH